MDPRLEQRILGCGSLPSLPAAALELLRQAQHPEVDLAAMAETISRDPALAARVLRLANSAALGFGDVSSLPRAVVLLGVNAALSVALSFSLARSRRRDDADGFDRRAYWQRAFYSALAAQAVAERRRLDPQEAFLGGLLQDIGMLALAEALAHLYPAIARRSRGNHLRLAELERAALGSCHAEVSLLLAHHWGLPGPLREALGASHRGPGQGRRPAALADVVQLSGLLADVWLADRPVDVLAAAVDAAREMGLDRDEVAALLARMGKLVPETSADFDVRLAGQAEIDALLAAARAALTAHGTAGAEPPLPATPAALTAAARIREEIEAAVATAEERGTPLSVLGCRVHFRPPEAATPERMDAVARHLARVLRAGDSLGRRGDMGLVAVLPGATAAGAASVAGRLTGRTAPFDPGGACVPGLALSLSVEAATFGAEGGPRSSQELLDWLEAAAGPASLQDTLPPPRGKERWLRVVNG